MNGGENFLIEFCMFQVLQFEGSRLIRQRSTALLPGPVLGGQVRLPIIHEIILLQQREIQTSAYCFYSDSSCKTR